MASSDAASYPRQMRSDRSMCSAKSPTESFNGLIKPTATEDMVMLPSQQFVLPLGIEGPAFHSQERNRPHARQSSGGPIPNFREDKDDHPKLTAEVRKFPLLEGEAEISAVRVEQHESDASVAHPRLGYRSRPIHHWAYCGGSASLVR
ncbi:hypothetical protein THAOC_29036, partial [Thalassiosira oceanica]